MYNGQKRSQRGTGAAGGGDEIGAALWVKARAAVRECFFIDPKMFINSCASKQPQITRISRIEGKIVFPVSYPRYPHCYRRSSSRSCEAFSPPRITRIGANQERELLQRP